MSKALKERIVYFISMALGVLTLIALFFPFMTITREKIVAGQAPEYYGDTLMGFNMIFNLDCVRGDEAEGLFLVFTIVLALLALASIVWGLLNFLGQRKNPDQVAAKKWFILFQLVYCALTFCMMIGLNNYLDVLNNSENAINKWSIAVFYATSGNLSTAGPCVYILLALGVVALVPTCVLTAMLKDNSLVFPYRRREIITSAITIVACIAVFFLPLFNYYYSTNYINVNAATIYDRVMGNGADLTTEYLLYDGYEIFYFANGGMAGYIKVLFYMMIFVSIATLAYNVFFLLAAFGVFRINFDRKLNNKANLALMVMGIMIFVGCLAYCYGVNFQLDRNWETYSRIFDLQSIWTVGQFPRSYISAGAIVALYPIASYLAVRFLNEYPD